MDNPRDLKKVLMAGGACQGAVKHRWVAYVNDFYDGDSGKMTWDEAVAWFKEDICDPATRAFKAEFKLETIKQQPDEP